MRMTVVTDRKGRLIASMFEDPSPEQAEDAPNATLRPGPGQVFDELDVPDDYAKLSPDELHETLRRHHLATRPSNRR
ncbi:MAG TPA: hypothetical protein VKA30_02045 [Actinomycetota bacterium]|nr:hypothetical protein [Actinomycetota bacterium]